MTNHTLKGLLLRKSLIERLLASKNGGTFSVALMGKYLEENLDLAVRWKKVTDAIDSMEKSEKLN